MQYGMFRPLLMSRLIVADRVVNIVMYIPVADATAGWMSSRIKKELKMTPGPTPDMAARKAAKNATNTSKTIFFPFKS